MSKRVLVAFSVVSPLHLVNVLSVYENNSDEYDEVIINITTYWKKNIIPARYLQYCRKRKIKVLENENVLQLLLTSTDIEYDFIFINNSSIKSLLYSINKLKVNNIFFVDEGISSYSNLRHMFKALCREQGVKEAIKYSSRSMVECVILYFFRRKIKEFRLFDKDTLAINYNVKESLLKLFNDLYPKGDDAINFSEKVVLYCSQPWVELGVKTKEEYAQELLKIQSSVKKKGYVFLVKKHPVDALFDYNEYNIDLLSFDGIIEEYVANNDIVALISINSTSSLYCGGLFGTKSYIYDTNLLSSSGVRLKKLFSKYCYNLDEF